MDLLMFLLLWVIIGSWIGVKYAKFENLPTYGGILFCIICLPIAVMGTILFMLYLILTKEWNKLNNT